MNFEEIASNNKIMFIIALISLILGVLGGIGIIFTIKSYRSQKKTEHAYEQILTVAKQDWEGKYTEEEIVKLNAQLNDLTVQINNVIPQKARKALLEYKEEQLRIELETIYDEYNDLKKELSTSGIKSKLSPEIEAKINSEINKKMGRSTYNNKLLVIIAAILLFSIPSVYSLFNRFSEYVIWLLGAHITVSLLSFYIVSLLAVTLLFDNLKFNKTKSWVQKNKKKGIGVVILLFALWITICYLITYDVFITSMIAQAIFAILSIIVFSYAIVIFKQLFWN